MAGRASKRTEENAKTILDAIEVGDTRRRACALVGMSEDTLKRWEKTDADFAVRLMVAEARRDRSLVVDIRTAARKGDWRAAAWLLERVAKEDYGTNKTDVNIVIEVREKAERLAEQLGVPVEDVIREAEAVAAGKWDSWSPQP